MNTADRMGSLAAIISALVDWSPAVLASSAEDMASPTVGGRRATAATQPSDRARPLGKRPVFATGCRVAPR